MGGSYESGNIAPCAEFNIFMDPEAVEILINCGLPIVMIPLEVTMKNLVPSSLLKRLKGMETEFAEGCYEMLTYYAESYKKWYGLDDCPLHDPLTIAYCIAPHIFTGEKFYVTVETGAPKCRG